MSGGYCAVLSTHTSFIFNSLEGQFDPIKILYDISVLFFAGIKYIPLPIWILEFPWLRTPNMEECQ